MLIRGLWTARRYRLVLILFGGMGPGGRRVDICRAPAGALQISWAHPERQCIRYTALGPRAAHYVHRASWSSPGTANDHLIEGFNAALGSITVNLGTREADYVARETGRRMPITRNYEIARSSLEDGRPDSFVP